MLGFALLILLLAVALASVLGVCVRRAIPLGCGGVVLWALLASDAGIAASTITALLASGASAAALDELAVSPRWRGPIALAEALAGACLGALLAFVLLNDAERGWRLALALAASALIAAGVSLRFRLGRARSGA